MYYYALLSWQETNTAKQFVFVHWKMCVHQCEKWTQLQENQISVIIPYPLQYSLDGPGSSYLGSGIYTYFPGRGAPFLPAVSSEEEALWHLLGCLSDPTMLCHMSVNALVVKVEWDCLPFSFPFCTKFEYCVFCTLPALHGNLYLQVSWLTAQQ